MRTLLIISLLIFQSLHGQSDFIEVKHNKVLSILSFVDTAANAPGSPPSYVNLIQQKYGGDIELQSLVGAYQTINFRDAIERERFPKKRSSYTSIKDLLWIASAVSTDLKDFSERSFGALTPDQHKTLMEVLQSATPYYDELIWSQTKKDRERMEQDMATYTEQISKIFKKVQHFLGSSWDETIPFKIMLYPIPLKTGGTSAIPKGNNLICSYLSQRDGEAKDIVGIAVHEMNHILYSAQPLDFQKTMDTWFTASSNPIALMAYNFFDEGLATAVGNGWAYEAINGKMDEGEWYNVSYINTYGKLLYPLVTEYMNARKQIDKDFVERSIELFANAFPKANTDLGILMNSISLFAPSDEDGNIELYFGSIRNLFALRSASFIYPLDEEDALTSYKEEEQTKIIILDKEYDRSISFLREHFEDFPNRELFTESSIIPFYDKKSSSPVIVAYLQEKEDFPKLLELLQETKYITYGKKIVVP